MKCRYSRIFGILILIICISIGCDFALSKEHSGKELDPKNVYLGGEMHIQHGMELFNQHCASCHNFSENLIGPNLSGITYKVDKEWLVDFIKNPIQLIENGDSRAVELFDKYQQYMPPFPMFGEEDIEDVLAFIHKFSQAERRNTSNREGGLINPIPQKIATSNLTLILKELFRVPASSEISPITRINQMSVAPGGRLFIHDLRGQLFEIKNDNELSLYMDFSKALPHFIDYPGKGSGLGSFAFHPDFEKNGLLYTTHTEPPGSSPADYAIPDSINVTLQCVLLEWKVDNPKSPVFSGKHRELLRVDMYSGGHTFQEVTFNPLAVPGEPDYGMLFLGIGDGASAIPGYTILCDNVEHIWGSVIRIDPLGNNSTNRKYGIPADNPFVNIPKALSEIWANGFRNPHRISWDKTGSGKMFITNIGQHSVEEVNLGKAGANYGWPYREGTFLFDVNANVELVYPLPNEKDHYTYPVVQYDHDEGTAVAGGFVYAGTAVPQLRGKYIFGDISRGMLFYSEVTEMNEGQQATIYRLNVSINDQISDMESITENRRVDLRIGMDGDGELYVFTKANGAVYKIIGCLTEEI